MAIVPLTPLVGADNPAYPVSKNVYNAGYKIDQNGAPMAVGTSIPVTPATDNAVLWLRGNGGRKSVSFVDDTGTVTDLQAAMATSRIYMWINPGAGGTMQAFGGTANFGTATNRSVTFTNYFSSLRRQGFLTANTANANNSARGFGLFAFIGNAPKMGGFHNVWRVGVSAYHVEARAFIGLGGANSSYGSVSPSSRVDCLFFGFDPGDTNWQIFHNDSVGTPTKIDLGSNFPCNTNNIDFMEFSLFSAPGSAVVGWSAKNLTTGLMSSGVLSTDLPINVLLQPHLSVANGASATVVGIDFAQMYLSTEN